MGGAGQRACQARCAAVCKSTVRVGLRTLPWTHTQASNKASWLNCCIELVKIDTKNGGATWDSEHDAFDDACGQCAKDEAESPTRRVQDMSHRREGKAVLLISQFSHNLSVSLQSNHLVKNLKLTQVEHACSA